MSVINCSECSKLCLDNPNKMCPLCLEKYLDNEIKVADYLRDHKNSTIDEVHQETQVEKSIILKMIREGRIIEGELFSSCEKCGARISLGRYCKDCMEDVVRPVNPAPVETGQKEHDGGGYKYHPNERDR